MQRNPCFGPQGAQRAASAARCGEMPTSAAICGERVNFAAMCGESRGFGVRLFIAAFPHLRPALACAKTTGEEGERNGESGNQWPHSKGSRRHEFRRKLRRKGDIPPQGAAKATPSSCLLTPQVRFPPWTPHMRVPAFRDWFDCQRAAFGVRSARHRPTCPGGRRPEYYSHVYYNRNPAAPQAIIDPLSRKLHNQAEFFSEGPRLLPQKAATSALAAATADVVPASSRGGARLPAARRAGFCLPKSPSFQVRQIQPTSRFVYQVHDFSGSADQSPDFAAGPKAPRGFFRKTGGRCGFSPAGHGLPLTPSVEGGREFGTGGAPASGHHCARGQHFGHHAPGFSRFRCCSYSGWSFEPPASWSPGSRLGRNPGTCAALFPRGVATRGGHFRQRALRAWSLNRQFCRIRLSIGGRAAKASCFWSVGVRCFRIRLCACE